MYLYNACYIVMNVSYNSKDSTPNQAFQAEQGFLGFFTLQTFKMPKNCT